MLISETSFHFLGATPSFDRKSLLELVEKLLLTGEEEPIRDAYRNVTLSTKRIIHELSWPIGLADEHEVEALIEAAKNGALCLNSASLLIEESPLAFCNLAAENLHSCALDKKINHELLTEHLSFFAQAYEKINAETLLIQINEYREKARFPIIRDINDVVEGIRENTRIYIATFQEAYKTLPATQYIRVLTSVIEKVTSKGAKQNLIFLEELVSAYNVEITEKLKQKEVLVRRSLTEIISLLKEKSNNEALELAIENLKKRLSSWDFFAQPIQVSFKSQGKEHTYSTELAKEVRSVALLAHNEHGRSDISIKICELLAAVFEEVPNIKSIIDDDREFLSKQIVVCDEDLNEVMEKCLILSTLETSPEESLREVESLITIVQEKSSKINEAGQVKEIIVNTLKGLAIYLSNEKKAYLASLAVLNEALAFVIDEKQKKNIEENIEIIQGNLWGTLSSSISFLN